MCGCAVSPAASCPMLSDHGTTNAARCAAAAAAAAAALSEAEALTVRACHRPSTIQYRVHKHADSRIAKHARWCNKTSGFSPSQRPKHTSGLLVFPEARRQACFQLQISPAVSKSTRRCVTRYLMRLSAVCNAIALSQLSMSIADSSVSHLIRHLASPSPESSCALQHTFTTAHWRLLLHCTDPQGIPAARQGHSGL